MMSMWSEMLEERENREMMDVAWEVSQDLLEDTCNYQLSQVQSGPEFSQAEPYNQTQVKY